MDISKSFFCSVYFCGSTRQAPLLSGLHAVWRSARLHFFWANLPFLPFFPSFFFRPDTILRCRQFSPDWWFFFFCFLFGGYLQTLFLSSFLSLFENPAFPSITPNPLKPFFRPPWFCVFCPLPVSLIPSLLLQIWCLNWSHFSPLFQSRGIAVFFPCVFFFD